MPQTPEIEEFLRVIGPFQEAQDLGEKGEGTGGGVSVERPGVVEGSGQEREGGGPGEEGDDDDDGDDSEVELDQSLQTTGR